MGEVVLKVENLSKVYRLGEVGTGTISHDLNRWWAKLRGKEDPMSLVGQENDRSKPSSSDFVSALKDINFEVKEGEVLGIIGKNGAGKSTLLKLISKITAPTTGSIKAKGRIASLLEVGTGMHPEMTARENIFLNGAILGMRKWEIKKKFDEIIDFAGCRMYVDTPVKRFSSGMRVRLGFAVAAFLEPEILIVDEVLAVGDAEFQKKAIGKMKDVSSTEGRTVLFVSHNMASVKTLCNTGLILQNGLSVFSGASEDAVNKYLMASHEKGKESLVKRKDRIGNGTFKFVDFKLKNSNGKLVNNVISCESVVFEIHYESSKKIRPKDLILGLTIRDNFEKNIMSFLSDEMTITCKEIKNEGLIYLRLESLPLRGEKYSIRLLAFENTTSLNDALDIVDDAFELEVLPGDVNKVGKVNRTGHMAIQKAQFEIN